MKRTWERNSSGKNDDDLLPYRNNGGPFCGEDWKTLEDAGDEELLGTMAVLKFIFYLQVRLNYGNMLVDENLFRGFLTWKLRLDQPFIILVTDICTTYWLLCISKAIERWENGIIFWFEKWWEIELGLFFCTVSEIKEWVWKCVHCIFIWVTCYVMQKSALH